MKRHLFLISLLASLLLVSCDQLGISIPGTEKEGALATLTYKELGSNPSDYIKGYGMPSAFKNEYGLWSICAYNSSSFQINGGKIAYVSTPLFKSEISMIRIATIQGKNGGSFCFSATSGDESAPSDALVVKAESSVVTVDVSALGLKKIFIRSTECARIVRIDVVWGGELKDGLPALDDIDDTPVQPGPDGPDGPDIPDGPGPDQPDTPDTPGPDQPGPDSPGQTIAGWFELPAIADADRNGIDDNNPDIYYASHSFSMGGREYRNYTVCFDADQHCPLWIAAPRHDCYTGSTGRTDAYRQDPSIPGEYQYNSKSTGGGCNKGHMLGSAERTCSSDANRQVFYYTNIAPQLSSGFNTGGGGWNILEDYIDSQVCADTLYEVIGCYFDRYTDAYGNTVEPKRIEFGGRTDVGFPTMFYYAVLRTKSGNTRKSLKDCSESELQCVAFVRSHTNSLKGQRVTKTELMSVADLEKITGFSYFTNVPNAPKTRFTPSDWNL